MSSEATGDFGLTSQQILASPKNAVYVAIHPTHVLYVKSLAAHLVRGDLMVVAPGWVTRNFENLGSVVVDHGVHIGLIPSSQRMSWRRAVEHLSERHSLITIDDIGRAGSVSP